MSDEEAFNSDMSSRDRFTEGVWKYVIGEDDLVIGGVLYDGRAWESDGEGGVQRRLSGEERDRRIDRHLELEERLHRRREEELEREGSFDLDVE